MIHTNRCKNCGKTKMLHTGTDGKYCFPLLSESIFEDSGLAALDAHKEELYEAVSWMKDKGLSVDNGKPPDRFMIFLLREEYNKLQSILNQIEKEK